MESNIPTPLDKYLETPDLLSGCYDDLMEEVSQGGLLEQLVNVLVKGESHSMKFRRVYFHGKQWI
jgi:hypothetical protein